MTSDFQPPGRECAVREETLGRSMRVVKLENELISATILVDKGADIYELVYRPRNLNVLWKTPWGLKEPGRGAPSTFQSSSGWLNYYSGGWQEIFPSGGGPATYKGVEHNFHGEASLTAWDYELEEQPAAAQVHLTTRLAQSPFRLQRTMRVEAGQPQLIIREVITNEGGEEMAFMWGHHPAYGAPFLDGAGRLDIGAGRLQADDLFDGPHNPLKPAQVYDWPLAGDCDLSQVPGPRTPRHLLAYFKDFEAGWYGLTNTEMGLGVGLVWPKEIFPYAWFWQEMHASEGFPWYKAAYTMAVEPFSSIPGQGLTAVMEKTGTQRTLEAGASVEAEIRAVFYESTTGVAGINPQGQVTIR